ncbi:MAG: tetratricopeptide repeat protein, partial [Opitutaceae bacterium]
RRLGLLAARREDFAAAERHFSALARIRPDDADAHANLGNVLLLTGRAREAAERFETALRLRPVDDRLSESLAAARRADR